MLLQLIVKDFALSEKNVLDFSEGMTCITGETGAGKSLSVDALSLILGSRADSAFVRNGCDKAEISAVFSIDSNELLKTYLKEHDLSSDDTSDLVIRRVVTKDGKSKAYINDVPCTLSVLKEVTDSLVAIHGQHASVKLIDEKNQLNLLDSFAGLSKEVSEVASSYDLYISKRNLLQNLADEQLNGANNYKTLRFELDELEKLDLHEGDYEKISSDFDALSHLSQAQDAIALAQGVLENDEHNIIDIISARISDLSRVSVYAKESIDPIVDDLTNAASLLDRAREKLDNFSLKANPQMVEELSEKLSKCHELARRFKVQPNEVHKILAKKQNDLEYFLSLKEKIAVLTNEVKSLRADYEQKASALSEKRAKAAKKMSESVTDSIHELAMSNGVFNASVTRDEESRPRRSGRDEVKFLFSANIGQEPLELSTVASGGELSRLALAIEVLTSTANSTQTLIFDEVDTGISGRTASSVGSLLRRLSSNVQVITVTHLPQVAAMAHHQFLVTKIEKDGSTSSFVQELDEKGRIEEIARMMGGNVITEDTRCSAKALLDSSGSDK